MKTSAHNLTHEWILTQSEIDAIDVTNPEEMTGNSAKNLAQEIAFERANA